MFLGGVTAEVVEQLGVYPAVAGWILGVVTSLPEMVTFFAVYAASSREGRLQKLNDTQEALDNLTGSNMANVGIVYPIGLLAYLLGSSLPGRLVTYCRGCDSRGIQFGAQTVFVTRQVRRQLD
jgi:Ca2+/Na+ antiporter